VESKMAESNASGAADHTSPADSRNFEHGAVSSDAVYVPHSKQSSRGQRGRGNYRHGNQQNGGVERSEYGGPKQSGAGNRYSGGRGRKAFGQRGQYYGRRNLHSAAYERNAASFDQSANDCYSQSNVADASALYSGSTDTDDSMQRSCYDDTEFNAPFRAREHARNPRVSRNNHRYEERNQRRDFESSRGAPRVYRRARGPRGASSYSVDDRFGMSSVRNVSAFNNSSREAPVAGFEAYADGDLCDVTEFGNSDRKQLVSKAWISSNDKLKSKNEKYNVSRPALVSHDSYDVPGSQFQDLCISTEAAYLPNDVLSRGNVRADAKIKNSDPEFETQRGYFFLN